jgi:hypothetical protein
MVEKELKPIKEYKLSSVKQAHYIPVLDRDPVLAARAIVKKDMGKFYKYLVEAFEEIRKDKIYSEPLVETILFSKENFLWFAAFLKELENILRVEEYEVPFEKAPSYTNSAAPIVYHPFYANTGKNSLILSSYRILSKKLHPINNHRIKYIMENYDMSEFVDDSFPAWYLIKDTTVFEQYSEKTNTRVRVDFKGGEFSYFIAGASDNWKRIEGVPLEMDHVIAALIFRSYSDDF